MRWCTWGRRWGRGCEIGWELVARSAVAGLGTALLAEDQRRSGDMARRKSSGLFETLVKTVFRTGTTVHRHRDLLGRKVTKVEHHDTGKTKTYTHGTGLFRNSTRTVTTKDGNITERGKLKIALSGI